MDVDIQYALDDNNHNKTNSANAYLPTATDFNKWVAITLAGKKEDAQLTIRIVSEDEIANLNEKYRFKKGPTNVLSFPADYASDIPVSLIGDIIICAPIVKKEAESQAAKEALEQL